jgi:DNA-binding beta-propeller fold protein YncE
MQDGFKMVLLSVEGNAFNQFNSPHGIYLDNDQTIYITDYENHRIVKWESDTTNGQLIAGGNRQENEMNQLNQPIEVILDKEKNNLIICDYRNRMDERCKRRNCCYWWTRYRK